MNDDKGQVRQAEFMKALLELQHTTFELLITGGIIDRPALVARLDAQAGVATAGGRTEAASVFVLMADRCRTAPPAG